MKTEQQHREEIVRFGKLLHQAGLVAATDGNLSVRLRNGAILCTPTLMSKGLMQEDDLVIVDEQGKKLSGSRGVSSEIAMHLLIYGKRPDIGAVVHAHPPTATGSSSPWDRFRWPATKLPVRRSLLRLSPRWWRIMKPS
jgi:L-fuculose-phosphate aldolase